MKINFISIESSRPSWAQTAFNSYEKRFNKSIKINWLGIKPPVRERNYRVEDVVQKEGLLLNSKIKKDDFVIVLDKDGKSLTTEELKVKLDQWFTFSKDISIIIGGPDGLCPSVFSQGDYCLSLSKFTFPHSMVPVIAIEQIYRVWSITQNHPYHK